jgi:hypothetical protein
VDKWKSENELDGMYQQKSGVKHLIPPISAKAASGQIIAIILDSSSQIANTSTLFDVKKKSSYVNSMRSNNRMQRSAISKIEMLSRTTATRPLMRSVRCLQLQPCLLSVKAEWIAL